MRQAFDACVVVTGHESDEELLRKLCGKLIELGYKGAAFTTTNVRRLNELKLAIKRLSSEVELDLVLRLELEEMPPGRAKKILAKYRRSIELISMAPKTRHTLAFASRDRRIDILYVAPTSSPPLYRGDWRYISSTDKLVELRVYPLMTATDTYSLARVLRSYMKLVKRAPQRMLGHFLLSSGAGSPRYLCTPHSLKALAHSLGFPDPGFSKVIERVTINRDKIRGLIPVPGVRVVHGNESERRED